MEEIVKVVREALDAKGYGVGDVVDRDDGNPTLGITDEHGDQFFVVVEPA